MHIHILNCTRIFYLCGHSQCIITEPCVVDGRKLERRRRRVEELLETRPALSAPSQKVLLLFMVTF